MNFRNISNLIIVAKVDVNDITWRFLIKFVKKA